MTQTIISIVLWLVVVALAYFVGYKAGIGRGAIITGRMHARLKQMTGMDVPEMANEAMNELLDEL